MQEVWGAALAFLFVLATLSGYGAGTPQVEKKDKSEQSDKKDEDKKNEEKINGSEKSDKHEKSGKKGKSSRKDKGSSTSASRQKAEYCIKDCPETWRIRP